MEEVTLEVDGPRSLEALRARPTAGEHRGRGSPGGPGGVRGAGGICVGCCTPPPMSSVCAIYRIVEVYSFIIRFPLGGLFLLKWVSKEDLNQARSRL